MYLAKNSVASLFGPMYAKFPSAKRQSVSNFSNISDEG